MPNCPIRDQSVIRASVDSFLKKGVGAQISCFKFGWMNPWWAATVDKNNKPSFIFDQAFSARSQDLPELYCPTGAIWVSRVEELKTHKTFYSPDFIFHETGWKFFVDIDKYEDLDFAAAVLNLLNK